VRLSLYRLCILDYRECAIWVWRAPSRMVWFSIVPFDEGVAARWPMCDPPW